MLTPLVLHLFARYQPNVDSHKGYPLQRALIADDRPLIEFLLRRGADPALKDGLALQIALNKKRLDLVRMLVEGGGSGSSGRKRKRGGDTRVPMTPELMDKVMATGSREIQSYFVDERGFVPNLKSIMALR